MYLRVRGINVTFFYGFYFLFWNSSETPNTNTLSIFWLCPGTSITNDRGKLVLWAETSALSEMMRLHKCFPNGSKIPHPHTQLGEQR